MDKCRKAKQNYSTNIVNNLKESNPSQWYSKVKRMASHKQESEEDVIVQELLGQSDQIQAERIADQFSEVSGLYSPLKSEDINLECIRDDRPPPEINPYEVYLKIMSHKKKTATVVGDVPIFQ